MEKSLLREANRFSAIQEILDFMQPDSSLPLYNGHRLSLSGVRSIPSMPHPSYFLKIHLKIILPSMPGAESFFRSKPVLIYSRNSHFL